MNGHVTDLIDAYALGELDGETRSAVREHLSACEICGAEYNGARAVLDLLPQALDPVKPHERVLQTILARVTPSVSAPRKTALGTRAALAAALVLAVGGDIVLGVQLANRQGRTVTALATPAPQVTTIATVAPSVSSPQSALPTVNAVPQRGVPATVPPAIVKAVPMRTHAAVTTTFKPLPAPTIDVARVMRERDAAVEGLRVRSTEDAGRIAQLEHRLALRNGRGPREAALLAALQNGSVYAIKGTVDGETWRCTVLQQSPTSNALLVTSAPGAPAGEDYRVWVVRDKRTYDAGSIAPRASVTLEMPMPLVAGDVVAFSREPQSTGNMPTQPYLMELSISN